MKIRTMAAVFAAKSAGFICRKMGRQGVTWAGKIALKINPDILEDLSSQVRKKIFVTCGTNGKTTTNNMLCAALENEGQKVVCNHTGSNMLNGVVAAFVLAAVGQQLSAHDHTAEIGDQHGGEQGNDDPNDGDGGGLLDHRGLLNGHEAHQNVRHTEVAQTPAKAADDILPAGAEDATAEITGDDRTGGGVGIFVYRGQRRGIQQLAVTKIDYDRHQHQC